MFDNFLEETQRFLKDKPKEINVTVMPDFFLDRLITLDCNEKVFCKNLESVTKSKGGSIDGVRQTDIKGGNAVNMASALAALDVNVTPILCTNSLGSQLIKFYLRSPKLDLSHVKTFDDASLTTAIEFMTENGKVNAMLRDVGALASFGPKNLDGMDFDVIEDADYICVFNWAGTKQCGTELAKTVFRHAKVSGKGKTYYDTADPTPNKEKIPELMKNVLLSKLVDILSLNENEAICYASQLSDEMKARKGERLEDLARRSAGILASQLSARVDLHTTSFSATFSGKKETTVPAFKIPVLRATGSGDAWNAGNILGDANELSDGCRLTLANTVAAYYISNPNGTYPTRKQLIDFLKKERKAT